MTDGETAFVLAVLFLATLVRSAIGFGDALIGMPLLALAIPSRQAAPLIALSSLIISAVTLLRDRWHVEWGSGLRLLIAGAVGIPCGVLFLTHAGETVVRAVLAVVLLLFSVFRLARPEMSLTIARRWAWPAGFCAGVLGGAYNTHGPPLVIYGTLRQWSSEQFRATLQSYFLPAAVLVVLTQSAQGLMTRPILILFGQSLPGLIAGVLLGRWIHTRINQALFERLVYLLLFILGAALLLASRNPSQ